eukprot:TRINITY_DN773_c1_g3_i2.p2 TRINITY_DN773_c1_g3~~TRINITY_DN773_c1_g3_i2.p2  ORF type:complete len:200 (-),score=-9.26 TRINITY_DN773_c1_g3_i2:1284-1883(-)
MMLRVYYKIIYSLLYIQIFIYLFGFVVVHDILLLKLCFINWHFQLFSVLSLICTQLNNLLKYQIYYVTNQQIQITYLLRIPYIWLRTIHCCDIKIQMLLQNKFKNQNISDENFFQIICICCKMLIKAFYKITQGKKGQFNSKCNYVKFVKKVPVYEVGIYRMCLFLNILAYTTYMYQQQYVQNYIKILFFQFQIRYPNN